MFEKKKTENKGKMEDKDKKKNVKKILFYVKRVK